MRGDHAGSTGKNLAPFGEGTVGGDQDGALFIATGNKLEEKVGVTVRVREVANLVDDQKMRRRVVMQTATEERIAVNSGEFTQKCPCGGETDRMAVEQGLVCQIMRQSRFSNAVGTQDGDIGGILEEIEGHERLDGLAVATFGPVPVKITQGFEASQVCGLEATLKAFTRPLILLPLE